MTIWSTIVNRICMKCNVGEHSASIWRLHQGNISVSVMTNRKEKNRLLAFSRLHLPVLVTHLWGSLWTSTDIVQTVTFPIQKWQATSEAPKGMSFFQSFSRCFLDERRKRSQIFYFCISGNYNLSRSKTGISEKDKGL